jgi:hypothetical protein
MDYRYLGKRRTLAVGVYPAVSLAKARQRREKARELLADGIDPGEFKREQKQAKLTAASLCPVNITALPLSNNNIVVP